MSRRLSYQEKHPSIYDSDSDSDDDNSGPLGKKINYKGNYLPNIPHDDVNAQDNSKGNNETLKKNRQSARECRQRKKIYIDLLEKKVEDLKKQIETSKSGLKSELKMLTKLTEQIDPDKMNYLSEKMEIEKGLASQECAHNPKQLQTLLDLYLYKFDVNGKLRKQLVGAQFENLLKLMLDHKLFNYWDGSAGVTEILENNCFDIFAMEVNQSSHSLLASNINNNRSTVLHLLMQIRDVKKNLEAQGERIQYLVEKLAKHLSPEGILRFILHPLYISEANRLDLGVSFIDSMTSVSTKKVKRE